MAIRVVLTNKSQQTKRITKSVPNVSNEIQLSRVLYQHLRSLTQNKDILASYDNGLTPKEYVDILDEFSKLNDGELVSLEIKNLDEYLSSLGVTAEYHYTKDQINIEPWLETSTQYPTRNVIDRDGNNVIDRNTGYNVIHNTTFEG